MPHARGRCLHKVGDSLFGKECPCRGFLVDEKGDLCQCEHSRGEHAILHFEDGAESREGIKRTFSEMSQGSGDAETGSSSREEGSEPGGSPKVSKENEFEAKVFDNNGLNWFEVTLANHQDGISPYSDRSGKGSARSEESADGIVSKYKTGVIRIDGCPDKESVNKLAVDTFPELKDVSFEWLQLGAVIKGSKKGVLAIVEPEEVDGFMRFPKDLRYLFIRPKDKVPELEKSKTVDAPWDMLRPIPFQLGPERLAGVNWKEIIIPHMPGLASDFQQEAYWNKWSQVVHNRAIQTLHLSQFGLPNTIGIQLKTTEIEDIQKYRRTILGFKKKVDGYQKFYSESSIVTTHMREAPIDGGGVTLQFGRMLMELVSKDGNIAWGGPLWAEGEGAYEKYFLPAVLPADMAKDSNIRREVMEYYYNQGLLLGYSFNQGADFPALLPEVAFQYYEKFNVCLDGPLEGFYRNLNKELKLLMLLDNPEYGYAARWGEMFQGDKVGDGPYKIWNARWPNQVIVERRLRISQVEGGIDHFLRSNAEIQLWMDATGRKVEEYLGLDVISTVQKIAFDALLGNRMQQLLSFFKGLSMSPVVQYARRNGYMSSILQRAFRPSLKAEDYLALLPDPKTGVLTDEEEDKEKVVENLRRWIRSKDGTKDLLHFLFYVTSSRCIPNKELVLEITKEEHKDKEGNMIPQKGPRAVTCGPGIILSAFLTDWEEAKNVYDTQFLQGYDIFGKG